MWVMFYTVGAGQPEADFFEVGEKAEIETRYAQVLQYSDLWSAGIAPISEATEPHWINPEFQRPFPTIAG